MSQKNLKEPEKKMPSKLNEKQNPLSLFRGGRVIPAKVALSSRMKRHPATKRNVLPKLKAKQLPPLQNLDAKEPLNT
jgi:hypothetical protein